MDPNLRQEDNGVEYEVCDNNSSKSMSVMDPDLCQEDKAVR